MATSGTVEFNVTRNEIIVGAARKCGAKKRGSTFADEDIADFNQQLNAMVKRWYAKGLHIWTLQEATLFPQLGQKRYALAKTATDHCAESNSYYTTAITAAEAAGQTVLSVDATTSMANAMKIGVTLDDGSIQWSTVSSFTSTTVTIGAALTGDAAADNPVYYYTSNIVRPLKVIDARIYDVATGLETPLGGPLSHSDYMALPNKDSRGEVTSYYYDPQLSIGYVYLWQTPADVDALVRLTTRRPIEDFTTASDNPDLPQEWIDTLIWNLAVLMAPEYGVSGQRLAELAGFATTTLDDLTGFDREEGSVFIQPDV